MFSKKATKIEEIFDVDLTVCSKCQIDGEDFVKYCSLLRKHELNTHTYIKPNQDMHINCPITTSLQPWKETMNEYLERLCIPYVRNVPFITMI